jgi:hypothetical protein
VTRIETRRLQRRLGRIAFGMLVVLLLPALLLLLPILLPTALAAEALTVRRLARTKCVACGTVVGLAAVRRARLEARERGRGIVDAALGLGLIPRVAVPWEVRCPTCGQAYECRPDTRRPALVAKS